MDKSIIMQAGDRGQIKRKALWPCIDVHFSPKFQSYFSMWVYLFIFSSQSCFHTWARLVVRRSFYVVEHRAITWRSWVRASQRQFLFIYFLDRYCMCADNIKVVSLSLTRTTSFFALQNHYDASWSVASW